MEKSHAISELKNVNASLKSIYTKATGYLQKAKAQNDVESQRQLRILIKETKASQKTVQDVAKKLHIDLKR